MQQHCTEMSSAYKPFVAKIEKGIQTKLNEINKELTKFQGELMEPQNNSTLEVNRALGLIGDGHRMTVLGAGVMSFGAGCGLIGLGRGAGLLRRYLCGGPPRQ